MIGTEVGKFRIEARLGEGRLGECWFGKHVDTGAIVTVKVFDTEVSASPAMERCLEQLRAMMEIDSPHIARVFECSRLDSGRAYLVREHVNGCLLRAQIEHARAETRQIADIMEQVASALLVAADAGVVHCDLHPRNVLLVPDPERQGGERAVVIDFGQGSLISAFSECGDPHYMAPEQDPGFEPSWRSDVYAIACMAFELATQRTLFFGARQTLRDQHRSAEPPQIKTFVPDIATAFDRLIARNLVKNPAERIKKMNDLRKLFELMVGRDAPVPSTVKADEPAFADASPAEVPIAQVVAMRVGEATESDTKAHVLLREGTRSAVEADRAERSEDVQKLRQLAVLQFVQGVEAAIYRRITTAFPKDVRDRWLDLRRRESVELSNAAERSIQKFLEGGDRPSLNVLARILKSGVQPQSLADTVRTACQVPEQLRAHLFEIGAIRNVLAHLPEYEEDKNRSIDGPRGLFIEQPHGDGTRKLLIDPAYLVSLEQICRELIIGEPEPLPLPDPE